MNLPQKSIVYALKIGNDYNHIWNEKEDVSFDTIKKDLEKTIDNLFL